MGELYGLSVRINDVFIPGKLVEDHLAQYCTSLGIWTGIEEFPIYVPGSATLLSYRGRYYMICTKHQLAQTETWDAVCLLLSGGPGQTRCITSGGARWFDRSGDGDHQEIVAFDYTEPCEEIPELRPMFFDFRGQHSDMPAEQIAAFITYGYPTCQADFNFDERAVKQTRGRVLSRFAAPSSDDALHVIEPITPLGFDPDGMSGGPTFCITMDSPLEFSAHFSGVTVRGGRTRLMLIKAGAVQAMLDSLLYTKR